MNTNTMTNTNTNSTAMPMKSDEFKRRSYTAYLRYVDFIEGNVGICDTVDEMAPLFHAFGFDLTPENVCNTLTVKMTAYGTMQGEKCRKIKSIATFRAFIKGGWEEVATAPVHYSAGKAPADKPVKQPRKTMTKKDLEAEVAALKAALEAAGIQQH